MPSPRAAAANPNHCISLALSPTGILLPLPRFSKFLHGVGALFQSQLEQLPNWFLPDEANPDFMTPATWEEMADNSDEHLKVGVRGVAVEWDGKGTLLKQLGNPWRQE